ncbi:hypothetical protein A2960_04915 [Candidatus Gottesmanbacteria bacterium RIFCSPLOWO2_01_FULL_39_12b]|uniref:Uncharacterized protein n=1 Tax=Candidatus Gottesmanbacteria bacterium RIFCSPLOWO2_01_FULL_39_12b TaxID=1798388 RepID=A0A1F6ANM6_9BACT|nr:MAG: hypothetical protein A2960_04915 [Candidatus Gottesmanbacteria bacterium RIFCSPLOWO2_01_FULL_39_12b]
MNENQGKGNYFWFGFFLGGLFGAFLIFVLGTKEGKKLTDELTEKVELYEEELEDKVSKLQKKGEELLQQAEAVKDSVVKEVEGRNQIASDALISKMDHSLSNIENIQKKGVELTQELHHRYFKKNGKSLTS